MTVNTAYNPFNQPVDLNGAVLSGAKWYFYENGTTTLKNVYQDQAKTSTHANPVIADANGRFPDIWLDGAYSIRIAQSDDTWITGTQMDDYNKGFSDVDAAATAGSDLTGFEYDSANSSGLNFKVNDGTVDNLDGTSTTITTAALSLSASTTNYVYLQPWTNTVVDATSAGGERTIALYEVITDASSIVTVTDKRPDQSHRRILPSDYISGLAISINGTDSDHDVDIAVGYARSSDDTVDGELTTAITKRIDSGTDANWKEGTNEGGLADGLSLATSTTYYTHLLIKPDGSCDAGFDTSATATNLLADSDVVTAGYTKYRQLGQFDTDGSSNIDATTFVNVADVRIDGALKGNYAQKIQQSAMGAAVVGQVEIKTTTASQSASVSSNSTGTITLTGGTYSMIHMLNSSFFDSGSDPANGNGFGIGSVSGSGSGSPTLTDGTINVINQGPLTETIYCYSRYFQASPPYDLGDGDIPLFIYVMVDSAGNPDGISVAPDPIWAYHGPTNIRAKRTDRLSGKSYKTIQVLPSGLTLRQAKKDNPGEFERFINGDILLVEQEIEITQAYKNQDKDIIPHPYTYNDNTGKTAILLDPVSPLMERLAMLHEEGESILELIERGFFIIDNADNGRSSAQGLMPVNFRWKNTGIPN